MRLRHAPAAFLDHYQRIRQRNERGVALRCAWLLTWRLLRRGGAR